MSTQRVNTYVSGSNVQVYYIEQYNEGLRQWFTVGGTFDKLEHASARVEHHNLVELMKLMDVDAAHKALGV